MSITLGKNKRKHAVKNSYGSRDFYSYYKTKQNKNNLIKIHKDNYSKITNALNKALAANIVKGKDVKLPHKMGTIELRKIINKVTINKDKLKISNPVNWKATNDLWASDDDARKSKTLVRYEDKFLFKIFYNKAKARFNNKSFYTFTAGRRVKQALSKNIKDNNLDAFML